MNSLKTIWIILVLALSPSAANAQAVANAEIRGVVTDSTGAILPNARIEAIQVETGRSRETVSGADGSYVLPNLPVGPYKLEVTAASFSKFVQSGIILQVGNNVQINVTMQVGTVSQEMSVSANVAMVETQNTSISEVVDQRRIVELPLNGRQATDLIMVAGGAAVAPSAAGRFITTHDYPTSVGVSVSGSQPNSNNYLLDGADHRDTHSNINLPYPFPDALQEFSVQTGGLTARNGVQSGALVNVVTKSGTNSIHGSLFEFIRNGSFNARNSFASAQDTLRRNQFGGTAGGPIVKDKIFVFGGYQGTRERTAPPQLVAYVPTQATLTGDFSAMASAGCQSNGVARTIVDPATRTPFAGNRIPANLLVAPSLALAKFVPTSADPCGRLVYSIASPSNENQVVLRTDWQQSSKHSLFARYFVSDYSNPPFFDNNLLNTTRAGLDMRTQAAAIGSVVTISPTLTNAAHLTFLSPWRSTAASPPACPVRFRRA